MSGQHAPGRAAAEADDLPAPLLEVRGLVRDYPLPRERLWTPAPRFRALDGVDFALAPGRSLGVVGESGSGKSTLARLVMALDTPTAGQVLLRGRDLHALGAAGLRAARRDVQMVFQDPYGSLDPRMTVERIVAEPLAALAGLPRPQQRERVAEVLAQVGLRPSDAGKYPHEFSGGQRQRIAIARAIITRPALVVADEPVSALDVSVQAQVLNLLQDLQEQAGLSPAAHQPRPGRGAPPVRRGRGAQGRPHRGAGNAGRAVPVTRASLYPGTGGSRSPGGVRAGGQCFVFIDM